MVSSEIMENTSILVILGFIETKNFSIFLDTTTDATFIITSNNRAKITYNIDNQFYALDNSDTKNIDILASEKSPSKNILKYHKDT